MTADVVHVIDSWETRPGRWTWRCACGESGVGSESETTKQYRDHMEGTRDAND